MHLHINANECLHVHIMSIFVGFSILKFYRFSRFTFLLQWYYGEFTLTDVLLVVAKLSGL